MSRMPALSLAAVPGRRRKTLDLAREIEQRGFSGIFCPSLGDGTALCEGIAMVTERIPFGTSIANIYTRHAFDFASTASFIHEISEGRFRFGIGVSHGRRTSVSESSPASRSPRSGSSCRISARSTPTAPCRRSCSLLCATR